VTLCPCGTGQPYDACCGRLHRGEAQAPTAEALMRSRYSAFAVGDSAYLLRSWHPSTRPASLQLGRTRWLSLEVVSASGGLFDTEGTVEFRATHDSGVMQERSRFVKEQGRWLYLDGT
jgi:SEC-C motif-containing protein